MSNETQKSSALSLDRLSIDRSKRPNSSGRSWSLLLLGGTVVVFATGAAWWYYQTTGTHMLAAISEKPVVVTMYEVPRRDGKSAGAVALVATGKIVSDVRVYVATKVSGQIIELNVEQGDRVQQGQVLARVEDDLYRAQRDEAAATVQRLEHAVDQTQAEYQRQLASIEEARANRAWREYNYQRLQRLTNEASTSDVELVEAQRLLEATDASYGVAVAAAESTRISIEVNKAGFRAAEFSLRLHQKRLDDCAIRAPITGVVLERNAQVGDFLAAEGGRGANANAQLVSIADMTQLRVEIDVSERDIHRVHADQRAIVTPDAYKSESYDGHVMWVDPIGDYARATVQVKVRIEDPQPNLRIEGSAKVEFLAPLGQGDTGLAAVSWLPIDAVKISATGRDALVFTVIDDRAAAHIVKVGARTDRIVEVTAGVYPGMRIIADRLDEIEDSRLVKVEGADQN